MEYLLLLWINTLAIATGVVAMAWAAARWLAADCAATRHAIWWAALIAVMLIPLAPLVSLPQTDAIAHARATASLAPAPALEFAAVAAPAREDAVAMPSNSVPVDIPRGRWVWALFGLWLAIVLVQSTRIVYSYLAIRGLKRRARPASSEDKLELAEWSMASGVRRPVRLLYSSEIQSPVAAGFLRPAVILPEGLAEATDRSGYNHALLHELAHLARWDDWTNLLARALQGVLALHPLAQFAIRRIDIERETACDDWVVAATGEARPYAVSLAALAELGVSGTPALLTTGISDGGSRMGDRIERLLSMKGEVSTRTSPGQLVLCGAGFLAMFLAASCSPQMVAWADQSPEPAATPAAPQEAAAPASTPRPTTPRPVTTAVPRRAPSPDPTPVTPAVQATAPTPSARPVPARESFLDTLRQSGYTDLSVEEIIELKIHGVDGRYMKGMNDAGFGRLTTKQLTELRIHGVTPEYVRGIRDAGLPLKSPDDAVQARIHGLSAEDVRQAKKYKNEITFEQMMRLKQAGVI